MIKEINSKIKDKQLILFGEIHGTKEIPEFLSKFFSEIAKEEDFNVCLEIPSEFQKNIKSFFKFNKEKHSDGRNSSEYFWLIKNLKNLNKKHGRNIKIFCIDMNSGIRIRDKKNIQNFREKIMAENILKSLKDKKTFVIIGDIHASKKPILFGKLKINSTGSILLDKIKDKIYNIRIMPTKGNFFNFGIKKIQRNKLEDLLNKNFDYIYDIGEVTPCSFLER